MTVTVVVPVYKDTISHTELLCLMRIRQLGIESVILAGPISLNIDFYHKWWPNLTIEYFEDEYFKDIAGYNQLMLSPSFYERFLPRGSSILLHQLDAILLKDRIKKFEEMPYDYFGAPWKDGQLVYPKIKHPKLLKVFGKRVFVGNGGLSLRKLSPTLDLLSRKEQLAKTWLLNEDAFFAYCGVVDKSYRSCPTEVASQFALETDPEFWIQKNGSPGMGIHGFDKCSPAFYTNFLAAEFLDIKAFIASSHNSQSQYP